MADAAILDFSDAWRRLTTINFSNTWKDMAPLKLFNFGEFKTAVYAFQQLHTPYLRPGA